MNQRKAGTILSYVYIIVTNTISLIYTPYMLRMMGQSEYGLYGTAASYVGYLSILSFGVGGAYIRFNALCKAANDREGEKRLNGMFLVVFSVLSLLVIIGGCIFASLAAKLTQNTFSPEELFKLRVIIYLMTFNTVITFLFNVVMMALQAYEKFICIRVVLLIAGIVQPIVNVIALRNGGRAIAISVLTVSVSFITYIIFYVYARKAINLQFIFSGFEWNKLKEIFIFSFYLFLNSISNQITSSTDQVVLSAVKGTAAVAIYNVGNSFCQYFGNFSGSISGVFATKVNQLVAQKHSMKELDEIFIKVGRVQFYVVSLILIGYTFLGYDFIRLWAGEDYSESYWIGLILIVSASIPCFQNVGIEIQKAVNKHKARSIAYMIVAVANIVLTIPMSYKWGGCGAAMATLICVWFGQVVFMNYYYHFHVGLDIKVFWKKIFLTFPGLVLPILLGIGIKIWGTKNSIWDILFFAVLITIVYAISVWCFSMNIYEKELFGGLVKKFFSHLKRKRM